MISVVLSLLLIAHFIATFYLEKSVNTTKLLNKLIESSAVYFIVMLLAIIPIFNFSLFKVIVVLSLFHFIINYTSFKIERSKKRNEKLTMELFLFEQITQVTIVIVSSFIVSLISVNIVYVSWFETILAATAFDFKVALSWLLALLIIVKPVSITIKKILYQYRPMLDDEEKGHPNAGSLIGILERCIILIFLFMGQYAAIGFVLTAKSIARYNKIVEDPKFSEYYLLGTLLSTLLVIVTYLFIFN